VLPECQPLFFMAVSTRTPIFLAFFSSSFSLPFYGAHGDLGLSFVILRSALFHSGIAVERKSQLDLPKFLRM
jgi:hypothetical protein